MDETKTYTIAEIMDAFDMLKAELDELFGPETGETERYLLDDVAIDIRAILSGGRKAADDEPEREADDDETLFVGQNYGWYRENGEW